MLRFFNASHLGTDAVSVHTNTCMPTLHIHTSLTPLYAYKQPYNYTQNRKLRPSRDHRNPRRLRRWQARHIPFVAPRMRGCRFIYGGKLQWDVNIELRTRTLMGESEMWTSSLGLERPWARAELFLLEYVAISQPFMDIIARLFMALRATSGD